MDLPPRRAERRPLATINVTPLVDVMLVLLIVFLVTASLGQQGITVALPRAEAEAVAAETITVTIDEDRRLYLDSVLVEEAQLVSNLRTRLRVAASQVVLLKADERVPSGDFVRVVSQIQAAGVEQLGMLTKPAEE